MRMAARPPSVLQSVFHCTLLIGSTQYRRPTSRRSSNLQVVSEGDRTRRPRARRRNEFADDEKDNGSEKRFDRRLETSWRQQRIPPRHRVPQKWTAGPAVQHQTTQRVRWTLRSRKNRYLLPSLKKVRPRVVVTPIRPPTGTIWTGSAVPQPACWRILKKTRHGEVAERLKAAVC